MRRLGPALFLFLALPSWGGKPSAPLSRPNQARSRPTPAATVQALNMPTNTLIAQQASRILERVIPILRAGDLLHGTDLNSLRSIFESGVMDARRAGDLHYDEIWVQVVGQSTVEELGRGDLDTVNTKAFAYAEMRALQHGSAPVVLKIESTLRHPVRPWNTSGDTTSFPNGIVKLPNIKVFSVDGAAWVPLTQWAKGQGWAKPAKSAGR